MSPFLGVSGLSGPGSLIGSGSGINLSDNYWFTKIYNNTGSGTLYGGGMAVAVSNVDGSVYFGGANKMAKSGSTITHSGTIGKLNIDGTLDWTRALSSSTAGEEKINSVACDSLGDVYAVGYCTTSGYINGGGRDFLVCKYNSSGTLQWQRILGNNYYQEATGITVDSSDNVYVTGFGYDNQNKIDPHLFKFNSSGTLQYQYLYKDFLYNDFFYSKSTTTDNSGNIYFGGQVSSGGSSSGFVHKSNSSGNTVWTTKLTSTSSGNIQGYDVAVDSSGNVFLSGTQTKEAISGGGNHEWFVSKFNSSGTLQWTRILGGIVSGVFRDDEAHGIAVTSTGDVVVGGHLHLAGAYRVHLIAKWNSNGVFQFQRVMTHTDIEYGDNYAYDLTIDREDNIYSIGTSDQDIVVFKVPGDGSLTSTSYDGGNLQYIDLSTSITIAGSSLTGVGHAAGSVFSHLSGSTYSRNASSFTDTTSTLTSSSITLTDDVSTIP